MLKIANLSVSVGDKKIINDLSLEIGPGEIHILMGPNGAGKTSLIMALMGKPDYRSTNGQITIDGQEVSQLKPDERAKQGLFVAFQKPVSIPGVSVENLLRLLVKDNLQERIQQASAELKIKEELLTRPLNENFSGGEAKKMELFQAKILKPKYLILDEVDSGLDIDGFRLLTNNLRQLVKRKDSPGILLITHNPRILQFLKPTRIHVLIHGTLVKSDGVKLASLIEKKGFSWLTKN